MEVINNVHKHKDKDPHIQAQGLPAVKIPLASIIIPVFNNLQYTKQCIAGLYNTLNLYDDNIEILVIDNNSTDGTDSFLKKLPNRFFRIITNEKNTGFSIACNQGANSASGKYIVFLNNDTIALPGWLKEMIKVIEEEKNVGVVGSKLLYPDGTIQHAGGHLAIERNGPFPFEPVHFMYKKPGNLPVANRLRDCPFVTGACLLIKKDIFFEVEGFDQNYTVGCEDIDLCLKVKQKGYRVVYCPTSVLYHYESMSEGRFNHANHNMSYFTQKWAGKIKPKIKRGDSVLTSIIIPCYNQLSYTKECVESIYQYTNAPFELILINNGSTDETAFYFDELSRSNTNVKIITNEHNLGYGAANNQGLKVAGGDYILFLNNDVVVTEGWLDRMLTVGEFSKEIGMVGPRSNAVSGVQAIEGVHYINMEGMHAFARERAAKNAGRGFEADRIVGFCMLVKREVINHIGGFDLRFRLGNFEDDDFCLRTRTAGYKIFVCDDVFIHHYCSRTFHGEQMNYHLIMTENWSKFKDKWGIPGESPYDHGYDPSVLLTRRFNYLQHYCPLVDSWEK